MRDPNGEVVRDAARPQAFRLAAPRTQAEPPALFG